MPDITINILVHERPWLLKLTCNYLKDIARKDDIKVNLLFSSTSGRLQPTTAVLYLADNGIDAKAVEFGNHAPFNFMDKIKWICDQPAKYSIRVDDDCILPTKTWNKLIESTEYLDDDNVLAIAPCVSNGLPTFEWFVDTFCDPPEQEELFQMVLNNPILDRWGIDYSNLRPAFENNKHGKNTYWDPDLYYKLLYEHGNDRLGVHPVRFSLDIQKRINQIILNKWERFNHPPTNLIAFFPVFLRPYYCNTCFAIKTDDYRAIINRKDLFRDAFEEIPFNLYRREKNLLLGCLTDSWALNMYFRSVGNINIEQELFTEIMKKVDISPK